MWQVAGAGMFTLQLLRQPKINPMNVSKAKTSLILACGLALVGLPCAFADNSGEHSANAMFKAMDTNGDSKVSRAEHAAHAQKMFNEADSNHDGQLSSAEMKAAHEKMSGKPAKDGMSADAKFKAMDTNGDGQVSQAEHAASADAMFTKLDVDGDGFLSASECAKGHDGMMQDKHSS